VEQSGVTWQFLDLSANWRKGIELSARYSHFVCTVCSGVHPAYGFHWGLPGIPLRLIQHTASSGAHPAYRFHWGSSSIPLPLGPIQPTASTGAHPAYRFHWAHPTYRFQWGSSSETHSLGLILPSNNWDSFHGVHVKGLGGYSSLCLRSVDIINTWSNNSAPSYILTPCYLNNQKKIFILTFLI
jgi:NAD-dependent dihydropyrimidine dehydrogenase PreA subunit